MLKSLIGPKNSLRIAAFLLLATLAVLTAGAALVVQGDTIVIRGQVLHKGPNGLAPVPYPNIGIINENVGTTADSAGRFTLAVPPELGQRQITFSALGFEARTIPVSQLRTEADKPILLLEKKTSLGEVVITGGKKLGSKVLGKTSPGGSGAYVHGQGTGAEIARRINPGRFPVTIDRVSLYIHKNAQPSFQLRVRLYNVDEKTGLPGTDLLNESVFLHSTASSGWVALDLTPYSIRTAHPFFVAFEWLTPDSGNPFISIQGAGNQEVCQRSVSQGRWVRSRDFDWVINAQVTYYSR